MYHERRLIVSIPPSLPRIGVLSLEPQPAPPLLGPQGTRKIPVLRGLIITADQSNLYFQCQTPPVRESHG